MKKELKLIVDFVAVFCRVRHADSPKTHFATDHIKTSAIPLCAECTGLVEYSLAKRLRCPLEPKPACKKCRIHCYGKEYRARIREVMAFSGRRMIMRGRLDYLYHYLF